MADKVTATSHGGYFIFLCTDYNDWRVIVETTPYEAKRALASEVCESPSSGRFGTVIKVGVACVGTPIGVVGTDWVDTLLRKSPA